MSAQLLAEGKIKPHLVAVWEDGLGELRLGECLFRGELGVGS